jgi:apolipoprotein N-acyltransferase
MIAAFGACAVAIAKFVNKRLSVPMFLTLPVAWTAGEWMRTKVPFSFPWNLLGYAVYRDIHLIQFAEITGVYGISALIIFVNVCVYEFLFGIGSISTRRRMLVSSIGVLFVALLFGEIRVAQMDSAPAAGTLRVALISGGLPPANMYSPMSKEQSFDLYRANTRLTLSEHPDLIIWPETSAMGIFQPDTRYSLPMAKDAAYRRELVELAQDSDTPILFGAIAFLQVGGKVTMLNRAYLLSNKGEVEGYYDKIKLVPFGEYLPMQWLLARHMRTITNVPNLEGGDRDVLFDVGGVKLGVRICYESVFPDLTRRAIAAGADILINISNDAWYGKIGAEQVLAMTAMRAVESKKPVVRVANQGFSAIISPVGRIQLVSQFASAEGSVREVSWRAGETVYSRIGDALAHLCVALTAAALAVAGLLSLTESRSREPIKTH